MKYLKGEEKKEFVREISLSLDELFTKSPLQQERPESRETTDVKVRLAIRLDLVLLAFY